LPTEIEGGRKAGGCTRREPGKKGAPELGSWITSVSAEGPTKREKKSKLEKKLPEDELERIKAFGGEQHKNYRMVGKAKPMHLGMKEGVGKGEESPKIN